MNQQFHANGYEDLKQILKDDFLKEKSNIGMNKNLLKKIKLAYQEKVQNLKKAVF